MKDRYSQAKSKKTRSGANDNVFADSSDVLEGVIDCKGDRFGFITPDDGGVDVFVAGLNLCGARHGDRVRAMYVRPTRRGTSRREARVMTVVERNPANIVATVEFDGKAFTAVPDDKHYGEALEITALGGASEHDKVIIELVPTHAGDCAKVLAVLGRFDEIGMDVKSVIVSHNLRTEFPTDVLAQAEAYPDVIDERDATAPNRVDFRGDTVFTIDGSDSKDFDDAVSLVRTDTGYRLSVHIADVAQYVTEGSPLDREAFLRGTSVYLADRVIPMLPEKLSNGLCSLNEGEDRLTLSVIMEFDSDGICISSRITEGVIRSAARMTYTGVQAILDGDADMRQRYAKLTPIIELMRELADKRTRIRTKRGSVDFDLTETQIKFDAVGHVVDIAKKPRLDSMRIIEEFMIAANCAVAERFCKIKPKPPFVFRVHERPTVEKIASLNAYLEAVGERSLCPAEPTPKQVASLLRGIDADKSAAVAKVALRAMSKATYEPYNGGHFGLAERFYCHFTSPIRRYPDLAIHRIIKAYLHGGTDAVKKYVDFAEDAASRSSVTERVAQDCERKVDDYKKAEYMSHKIGEKYEAVISSVTEFGFFAELDNTAEGLVRMSSLPPAATFDSRGLKITCGRKKFAIGDHVNIIVDSVEGDRINFLLA